MTTKETISGWFDKGLEAGWEYMVVMVDTYDYDDYPVYCATEKAAWNRVDNPEPMQRVMEVYDLKAPKSPQMAKRRAFEIKNRTQTEHAK